MSLAVDLLKREELGRDQALFSKSTFMQSLFWADLKGDFGFTPLLFKISYRGKTDGLVVMIRPVFKGFSIAYIPHGPNLDLSNREDLLELSKKLKSLLPKKCILIRYDLLTGTVGDKFPEKLKSGLKKSAVDIQVPDTTILNISPPEDELLKSMHKKTRYNIKLAGKKGVSVREASIGELDIWYDMYKTTAKRDSIAIHSKEYYRSVYNRANSSDGVDMKLLFAEHEEDLLAGIFVLTSGENSTYLYGASSNIKRNFMPAYLLQWEAIKGAKKSGSKSYDFFGIPPINDKKHSMHGLYRFKIGFGGDIIHRHGCYDYHLSPISILFRFAESLRNFYYKKLKKRQS